MGRDVVSAKLDVIFKKLFTENKDLLHSFVSSMLDIPPESIKEIIISNPELPPETIASKFSRLDLSLNVDDKLVNVEIQVKIDNDYRDRTLFYWAKLYTSELKSGEDYGTLKQTITINIINFNMFEGDDYHTEIAAMIKGKDEVFSDKFSMHFFELKKISKNPKTSREQWLRFINADSEEDFEMVEATSMPAIQKAVRVIYDMSEDTRIREIARLREKALHDEASMMRQATEKGIAEGIEIGEKKGIAIGEKRGKEQGIAIGEKRQRDAIIAKMKASGMSEEQIRSILS